MNIILKKRAAKNGVSLPENKLTESISVEKINLPERVILPLQQNLGAPASALVKKGDKVKTGDKIGESKSFVSALLHATVSGEVEGIIQVINPASGRLCDAIVIASDGLDTTADFQPVKDVSLLTNEEIIAKIKDAGIVGMGGATFPAHVKLTPPKDKTIDTLILNGCECEPYITSDHRVMLEYGDKVLAGLNLIAKVLSINNVYLAIEDNKEDAIKHLAKLISEAKYNFQIIPIKTRYPMGAEKTLVKTVINKEVPKGGLPLDVGAVVQNVSTTKAIYDAVYEGKPLIERVVTVTGDVKNPKNLLVRFGTPIRSLIDYCGGTTGNEVIIGGPMMGIAQFDLGFPITKGTNCILVKNARTIKESDCINCGRCVDVCPMGLQPTLYPKYVKKGRYSDCKEFYVENCVECGACTYACPAGIPIVQYIKTAKKEINKRKASK